MNLVKFFRFLEKIERPQNKFLSTEHLKPIETRDHDMYYPRVGQTREKAKNQLQNAALKKKFTA